MKVLLCALHAKYIHSAPGLYSIAAAAGRDVRVLEMTVNEPKDTVFRKLLAAKPDVLGFSVYLWNRRETVGLVRLLKGAMPDTTIILGGPEATYDDEKILIESGADYVVRGEGEATLPDLLDAMEKGENRAIPGVSKRVKDIVTRYENRPKISDLSTLPDITEPLIEAGLSGRMVYYEGSRGCPFGCAYCLSAAEKDLRFQDFDRVLSDMKKIAGAGVRLVKFCDRTFNADKQRALKLFRALNDIPGDTAFHFELCGDLLDDETLEFLKTVKPGKFQFEIGVQSTNPETLTAIHRKDSFTTAVPYLKKLAELGNIPLHLDLIAGLPFEDKKTFEHSFNEVFAVGAQTVQLGFLKLLKGSPLWNIREACGFRFDPEPVYETYETRWLTREDYLSLKNTEAVLELYWNSGLLRRTLQEAFRLDEPFHVLEGLGAWFYDRGLTFGRWDRPTLIGFAREYFGERFTQSLRLDSLLLHGTAKRPEGLGENAEDRATVERLIADEEWLRTYAPDLLQFESRTRRKRLRGIWIEENGERVFAWRNDSGPIAYWRE